MGVGIKGDATRLGYYGLQVNGMVELQDLSKRVEPMYYGKRRLEDLVARAFPGKCLDKPGWRLHVKWSSLNLSDDAQVYAATDAYAGLKIHQELVRVERMFDEFSIGGSAR